MFAWLARRRLIAFERAFDYDASYAHEMLDQNMRALIALNNAAPLGRIQDGVDRDTFYAARLTATLHEDCGPCLQLVVRMAENAGVDSALIAAVVERNWQSLPKAPRAAARFAWTTLERDADADAAREELAQITGKRGLVSIACAVTAARIYPTLKYALGHGHACRRVIVGQRAVVPHAQVFTNEAIA
ncbi:MAG TPA: hypothetical protein VHM70_19630 [Polyangiaceae bacterium]|jgi:alkylhydroperoxidase family enzyme|nr:hypothetical protein [Polyangiaceae bacterium]